MAKNWAIFVGDYKKGKNQPRLSALDKIEKFLKEKKMIHIDKNDSFTRGQYEILKIDYIKWDNKKSLNKAEVSVFSHFWEYLQ